MTRQRKAEYTEVEGKNCVIHRRAETWHMRIRLGGDEGYYRASCRTRFESVAREIAAEKLAVFRRMEEAGGRATHHTIASLSEIMLEELEADMRQPADSGKTGRDSGDDEVSIHSYTQIASKVRVLNRYWGDMTPTAVTQDAWKEYVKSRRRERTGRYGRRLSIITISHEKMVMKKILDTAISKKLITYKPDLWIPSTPRGKAVKFTVRPCFEPAEINKLLDYLKTRIDDPKATRYRYPRQMLYYYVKLMLNSGMRTNDVQFLRWRDVEIFQREDGVEIAKLFCQGKSRNRLSVTLPDFVPAFRELQAVARLTDPNHLVFQGRTGKARRFTATLRAVLQKAGLDTDRYGRVRTAYSLRHTFAMLRLSRPQARDDLLAANMGTSVEVLHRHYGSHVDIMQWVMELSG